MTQEQIEELRKFATASKNRPDLQVEHVVFRAAANPAAILALIQQRDELLAALKHIREYWNGDQNDMAMADACFSAINIAEEAITKAESKS